MLAIARLYAGGGLGEFCSNQLDDPLDFESALLTAQMAVGDQHQFAMRPADVHRLDDALGAALAGIQIDHSHGPALFESLFQFQRQQAFARGSRQKAHRAALLAYGIAQARAPPADRLHQLLKHSGRGLGIGQRAVSDGWINAESCSQRLQPISAAAKAPPGDPHRIQHRGVRQRLGNLPARATKFLAEKRQIESHVVAEHDRPLQQFHRRRQLTRKRRLTRHHRLRNARQRSDAGTDPSLRIDQLPVFRNFLTPLDTHNAELDHAMTEISGCARRFHVQKRQRRVMQGLNQRESHSVAREAVLAKKSLAIVRVRQRKGRELRTSALITLAPSNGKFLNSVSRPFPPVAFSATLSAQLTPNAEWGFPEHYGN